MIEKNLFKNEYKSNVFPMLLFVLVAAVFMIMTAAIYPAFNQSLNSMPDEIKNMYGDMSNFASYFSSVIRESWGLVSCIYAAYIGQKFICRDFKNGSSEFIYTLPVSRTQVVRSKKLVGYLNIMVLNVVCVILSVVLLAIFNGGNVLLTNNLIYLLDVLVVNFSILLLMMGFGMLNKTKFTATLSIFIIVLFYFLTNIALVDKSVNALAYFSIVTPIFGDVITSGFSGIMFNGISLLIWSVVAILTYVAGVYKFKNDDLC